MTDLMQDLVKEIEAIGAPYQIYYGMIYVHSRKEYEMKKKHPRKYKDLFVPYLRINDHDGRWYVRDCGWCQYVPTDVLMERIKELAA